MRTVGIETLLNSYLYQLSGGQKQCTAAVRALVGEPKLILPTGAVDSKSANDLLKTLAHLNEEHYATILTLTHDVYAVSFCRRIVTRTATTYY